jgi:hypothetical protein
MQACLSIADQGIGISAEEIPYLFRRFYRAESAKTQQIDWVDIVGLLGAIGGLEGRLDLEGVAEGTQDRLDQVILGLASFWAGARRNAWTIGPIAANAGPASWASSCQSERCGSVTLI